MAISARTALRAMLGLQVGLAFGLLGMDFLKVAPQLSWPSLAPAMDQPVGPGDQTRRIAPRLPFLSPGRGIPGLDTSDMPERLRFERAPEEAVLRLTGSIAAGDLTRFQEWRVEQEAADRPALERVVLNSPGGAVLEALELGRVLRAAGIATVVEAGGICLSACPYILIGGAERVVSRQARVGVHQHYYGESSYLPAFLAVVDIQRGQAEVVGYLDEMGVDLRLMGPAMATPPQEIYVLLPEELEDFVVATELVE